MVLQCVFIFKIFSLTSLHKREQQPFICIADFCECTNLDVIVNECGEVLNSHVHHNTGLWNRHSIAGLREAEREGSVLISHHVASRCVSVSEDFKRIFTVSV